MTISVVVATYNSEKTLRDTFDSILAQTYKDIEVIVQDGGSKDSTLDIVQEYASRFNGRLKCVSERDSGLYDGMNRGLKRATGDVIGILNSDDFYTSPYVLEKVSKAFCDKSGAESLDAVYGDIHFVKDNNLSKCVRYYSSRFFHPWQFRFGYMPAHPSFYCRRQVYQKFGLFKLDYKLAADYELLVRFIAKGNIKTEYLPLDMVTMRTGGASNRNLNSRLLLTKEDVRACRDNGIYTNFLFCSVKYLTKIFEFFC